MGMVNFTSKYDTEVAQLSLSYLVSWLGGTKEYRRYLFQVLLRPMQTGYVT